MFSLRDAAKYFKIDKSKVHIYLENHIVTRNKTVEIGDGKKEIKRYEITECKSDDLNKDAYEKEYWELSVKKKHFLYCIKDPKNEIILYGTKDSKFNH